MLILSISTNFVMTFTFITISTWCYGVQSFFYFSKCELIFFWGKENKCLTVNLKGRVFSIHKLLKNSQYIQGNKTQISKF